MTEDRDQELSRTTRAAVALFAVFAAGVFVVAINQTVGLIVFAAAPVVSATQLLGYPRGPDSVRDRVL